MNFARFGCPYFELWPRWPSILIFLVMLAVHTHEPGVMAVHTRKTLLACADPKREAAAALASSLMTQ